MSQMVKQRQGSTMLAMLIIIVVVAIVAAILLQSPSAARRGKETVLRQDLGIVRTAIEQFRKDCGDYPTHLKQIVLPPEKWPGEWPDWDGKGGTGLNLNEKGWQGPYLKGGYLPLDPFTERADWNYEPTTGEVYSSSPLVGLDGIKYSTW